MSLQIEVDFAPAYELAGSLGVYVKQKMHKQIDLGPAWAAQVRKGLSPALAAELDALRAEGAAAALGVMPLVWQCPAERDAAGFLGWLAGLSPGEVYERLAPYWPSDAPPLPDLGALRDRHVRLLTDWNEQYFRHLDPAVLRGLAADAESRRAGAAQAPPAEVVAAATGGVILPDAGPGRVVLVPQWHFRPWNLFESLKDVIIVQYPVDALPPAPGAPPPGLLRLTRALADESRLRMLRFLAGGPRRFAELVQFAGLAKSTVHYHLVVLRAAGLVQVHFAGAEADAYSLRSGAVAQLGDRLAAYLEGE